jgi:hypothetical protein
MTIKSHNGYKLLKEGASVILTNGFSHAPHLKYSVRGIVQSLKGLNGSMIEIKFTNGTKGYFHWSSKVEIG